jgi:hypothetical protein
MLKTGEKLQRLFLLLITWALLLVLFFAYERYFVSSQQAFLKESEFHALGRLSEELSSQVQRAQISTVSFVQLATGEHALPDEQLAEFLTLYLKDALSRNNDTETRRHQISVARKCSLTDDLPDVRWREPSGLALVPYCVIPTNSDQENAPNIFTLALKPWIERALQPLVVNSTMC